MQANQSLPNAFDVIRSRPSLTPLGHIPTPSLLHQAECRIGLQTDPMIVEAVLRLREADDHIHDLYYGADKVEDQINAFLSDLAFEHPNLSDNPLISWRDLMREALHSDFEDKLKFLRRYIDTLTAEPESSDGDDT